MRLDVTSGLGIVAVAVVAVAIATVPVISDSWITAKAKIGVLSRIGSRGAEINVDTVRGHVTLHGTVPREEDKRAATEAVKRVGVEEVRNLLEVVSPNDATRVGASDTEMRAAVRKALADDHALAGSNVSVVSVSQGVVLLSGNAASLLEHARAVADAGSVRGVVRVVSQIETPEVTADIEIWKSLETAGRAGAEGGDVLGRGLSERAKQATGSAMNMAAGAEKPSTTATVVTRQVPLPAEPPAETLPWRKPRTDARQPG